MTTVPCFNSRRVIAPYELNITMRKLDGHSIDVYHALKVRTVKLWLYLAKAIENHITQLPDEIAFKSVEMSIEDDYEGLEFDGFNENRVTIFDRNHKLEMTLHSNSLPQPTLDLYWANHDADLELDELYPVTNKDKSIQDTPQQSTNEQPATPKGTSRTNQPQTPVAPQNGVLMTKKEAIAKLQPGDTFLWRVVQLKKRSQDGKDYYEFYEPYGNRPGDFAAKSIFTDNEIAQKNGLITVLDNLGIKVGQALTGEWIFNTTVGKPKTKTIKGEEKTFSDIYPNSLVS